MYNNNCFRFYILLCIVFIKFSLIKMRKYHFIRFLNINIIILNYWKTLNKSNFSSISFVESSLLTLLVLLISINFTSIFATGLTIDWGQNFDTCYSQQPQFFYLDTINEFMALFPVVIVYENAETDKFQILTDNKDKAGIYQWKHKESSKIYIGSAFDLSKRLKNYFNPSYLKQADNYIARALLVSKYAGFSFSIIEYIDISNLDKEETRKVILEREQHFLNILFENDVPRYNLLPVAGSMLGFKHDLETISNMSLERSGENHPQFGKARSPETKASISQALSGENHPMYGKTHSVESREKISEAMTGENNPNKGKTGENSPNFGKNHSSEARAKMSAIKGGGTIYVYSKDHKLEKTYCSAREAAKYLGSSYPTILKYAKDGKLFRERWFLSLVPNDN
jgi:group I intron endonuclease